MVDHTHAENHFKNVPGHMFGTGDTPLRMQFSQAPLLPEGCTGIIEVVAGDGAEPLLAPLGHGQSCLSVTIENLDLSLKPEDIQKLQDELQIPMASAQHMLMVHECDQLAQSIARQFFNSAGNIDPTLHVKPVIESDGTVRAQHLQITMTGRANKHPFWNPHGI